MSRTSLTLGENESNFTSSSQAAYKKPSTDNLHNPAAKRNMHGTTFSLGPENQDGESNFISSNAASYGTGQPKASPARKESHVVHSGSNFTTSSSTYGSPTKKQKDNAQGSSPVYIGRHASSAARYPSADNVLASFGSANQAQGHGQAPSTSYSSTFVTSNAAAYKNPSGSSPSRHSTDVGTSSPNFQSSNSSYGKKTAPSTDAPAAGIGKGTQAGGGGHTESGNFQIGFATDSSFATSSSVAYSRPSENKERLQDHTKHSVRSTPVDSDNPLGPSNLTQGVLPSPSNSSLSSVSSSNSKNSNNQNYNSNNNNNQNIGRGISEKHKGLQRSTFNPITGE